MTNREMILMSKFAEQWSDLKQFEFRVTELDIQIATIDKKIIIDSATEVFMIASTTIIPLSKYINPAPMVAPFDFMAVMN